MDAIEQSRGAVRRVMRSIARALDAVSGGRITPNQITLVSVLAHFGIAWAIIDGGLVLAGILLVVFGLMDSLDGELARLQNRSSDSGIVLDAASDRYKEGIIYAGLAYYFAELEQPAMAAVAVMALASSYLISFVKTKGEAVLGASIAKDAQKLNRELGNDTLFRFEIRMALLVVALLSGWLEPILVVLAIGGLVSAILRYIEVDRRLKRP